MIDVRKYFNTDLPAILAANATQARTVGARYQFVITGPDGGSWSVDLTAKGPSCQPGKDKADCIFTLSDVSFRFLFEQPELRVTGLFMSGKLKIQGKVAVAMKLVKILSLVEPHKSSAEPEPSHAAELAKPAAGG